MSSPSCRASVPFADLVDYWLDRRPPGDPPEIEEHVFDCEACLARLASIASLGEAIRRLAREGRVHGALGPSLLARLERDGLVIRRYRADAGGHIHCSAGVDDDLVVLQLSADLGGVDHVDLVHLAEDGTVLRRVPRLPVVGGREVLWASPGDEIRSLPTSVMFVRLLAVAPDGERAVGEYTLHHTAHGPGDGEERDGAEPSK